MFTVPGPALYNAPPMEDCSILPLCTSKEPIPLLVIKPVFDCVPPVSSACHITLTPSSVFRMSMVVAFVFVPVTVTVLPFTNAVRP
ncbi:hypothetical protein R83H12_02625 [Fibrobacteria bacterium R8-3-H12]